MKLLTGKPSLLGVLFLTIIGISCEGVNLTGLEDDGVLGSWKLQTNSAVETYLSIDEDSLIFRSATPGQSCKSITKFEVKKIEDGSFFFLREISSDEEVVLAISRNDERVDVRDINDPAGKVERYNKSEIPGEMFNAACQGNGGGNDNGNGNGGGNGGNGNTKEIFGNWETFQGNQAEEYVSVSDSLITTISLNETASCFLKRNMRVITMEDSLFTVALDSLGSEQGAFIITAKGNGIEINKPGASASDAKRYRASEKDFNELEPECEDTENTENPEFEELTGQWETQQGNVDKVYLQLSAEELIRIEHQPASNCYINRKFTVSDINGLNFSISDTSGTISVTGKVTGNNIELVFDDGFIVHEERYKPSKTDLAELSPECKDEVIEEPEHPLSEFFGKWETVQGNQDKEYISINADSLISIQHVEASACYITKEFSIEDVNESTFVLKNGDISTQVRAEKKGNNIDLTYDDGNETYTTKYKPSNEEFSSLLPECSNEEPEHPLKDFFGNWETQQGNKDKIYVSIADTSISFIEYEDAKTCYLITEWKIEKIEGETITAKSNAETTRLFVITKKGNNIEIETEIEGQKMVENFKPSKEDFSTFKPLCTPE